jgi:polysaccharide biosynthesis/export protein
MGTRIIASSTIAAALVLSTLASAQQPPQQPAPQPPSVPDFVIQKPDAPAAPQTVPAPVLAGDQYVVGPQDQLAITVLEENDLTNKYRVDSDGTIQMPYIGRVQAAGLSVEELRRRITVALQNGWIRNPQVLVGVDQFKARSVIVSGAVRSPGKVALTGLTISLLEALTLAGSATSGASNQVIVAHAAKPGEKPGDPVVVDRRELELGRAGMDVVLQDGDIINVPEAKKFWISGQVKNPGNYVLDTGTTLAQALILAGGLTERGSDRRITIKRDVRGKVQEIPAKMDDKIMPNDEIIVGSRIF